MAEETGRRLAELTAEADVGALERDVARARQSFDTLARELSARRKKAAASLSKRVNAMMKELAMAGGRCEIALTTLSEPASYGAERVEFLVAIHPKQPLGPLMRVASGGELSRLALAIQSAERGSDGEASRAKLGDALLSLALLLLAQGSYQFFQG